MRNFGRSYLPIQHEVSGTMRRNWCLSTVVIIAHAFGCRHTQVPSASSLRNDVSTRIAPPIEACPQRRILNRYVPRTGGHYDTGGHYGVDFVVCPRESIVAISDGLVTYVQAGRPSGTGGLVVILHDVGHGHQMYEYVHLINIRISERDHVRRGEILGDAWRPNNELEWVPHVHLEHLNRKLPLERLDPMEVLTGCPSKVSKGPTYPVSC
jgi:hypothetical protein